MISILVINSSQHKHHNVHTVKINVINLFLVIKLKLTACNNFHLTSLSMYLLLLIYNGFIRKIWIQSQYNFGSTWQKDNVIWICCNEKLKLNLHLKSNIPISLQITLHVVQFYQYRISINQQACQNTTNRYK